MILSPFKFVAIATVFLWYLFARDTDEAAKEKVEREARHPQILDKRSRNQQDKAAGYAQMHHTRMRAYKSVWIVLRAVCARARLHCARTVTQGVNTLTWCRTEKSRERERE